MFSWSHNRACADQRNGGEGFARQRVAAGGARAWWRAQGLEEAQRAQFSSATVATGGCVAGIQRGDLAQGKIEDLGSAT